MEEEKEGFFQSLVFDTFRSPISACSLYILILIIYYSFFSHTVCIQSPIDLACSLWMDKWE